MRVSSILKNTLLCISYSLIVIFICDYIVYYVKLLNCSWPILSDDGSRENTNLKVLLIADPHLVGYIRGHPFDRLRRDWQMKIAFQAILTLHKPEVVFLLGDILDEGLWAPPRQFELYLARFWDIFAHNPNNTIVKCVIGNHDVGFHYVWNPYLNWRFNKHLQKDESALPVRLWSYKRIHFVIANSMAFEGDRCELCQEAERSLESISRHLRCIKRENAQNCLPQKAMEDASFLPSFIDPIDNDLSWVQYSKPILIQHFPLYRESEVVCSAESWDAMPKHMRRTPYRPKFDCLSRTSTQKVLRLIDPRLVLTGHSHYSCELNHTIDGQPDSLVPEQTIASFSWRNLLYPSFVLLTVSPTNYATNKCYLPTEPEIVVLYIVLLFLLPILYNRRRCIRRRCLNLWKLIWTRTIGL